jgi:hypothetical protein
MIEETAPIEDDRIFIPSPFRNTLHTGIVDISNSQLAWSTDFFGLGRKTVPLVQHFLLAHADVLHFFPFTKAPRCLKLLIPAPNAVGRWGITLKLSPEGPLKRNN